MGSSGYFKTTNGESFIAVYEAVTEVVQPQAHVVDIESSAAGTESNWGTILETRKYYLCRQAYTFSFSFCPSVELMHISDNNNNESKYD